MVLISEVKESGNVEAQLWHILQKEKYQAHATHATQERREKQVTHSTSFQLEIQCFIALFLCFVFPCFFLDKLLNSQIFEREKKKVPLQNAYFNK